MTTKHRRGWTDMPGGSFWKTSGGGEDSYDLHCWQHVSTLSEEQVALRALGLLLIHATVWKMSLWCEWESIHLYSCGLRAQLGTEMLGNDMYGVSPQQCDISTIYFCQCPTRCPLLLIHSVGLSHHADVQSNVMGRANTGINHYRLYNARTIMWAPMWVPEAKAPSPASHYSRCAVHTGTGTGQDRSDTHST